MFDIVYIVKLAMCQYLITDSIHLNSRIGAYISPMTKMTKNIFKLLIFVF
jgi:uncharacterized membrane protein